MDYHYYHSSRLCKLETEKLYLHFVDIVVMCGCFKHILSILYMYTSIDLVQCVVIFSNSVHRRDVRKQLTR
jgi:hypothetical protein